MTKAVNSTDAETPIDPVEAEFDAAFYLATNDDVASSGIAPWLHYRNFGWREKRDPTPGFSVSKYLDLHPDVAALGIEPFEHYVRHGRAEGRRTDHEYGLRYDILISGTRSEDRFLSASLKPSRAAGDPAEDLARALGRSAKRIGPTGGLHVTFSHDDYTTIPGGVQLCLRLESEAVQAAGRAHVNLHPVDPGQGLHIVGPAPLMRLHLDGQAVGVFGYEDVVEQLAPFTNGRPSSVAIHSLIGHGTDGVMKVAKAAHATATYAWLHDYSSLCASYALMRNDVAFCGAPDLFSNACTLCAYGPRRVIHLAEHAKLFSSLGAVILAPSASAADLWSSRFPGAHTIKVHPHAQLPALPEPRPRDGRAPLQVAFPGMTALHKGWPAFSDLVRKLDGDPRYDFHHLGRTPDPRLSQAKFTRVTPSEDHPEPMIDAVDALGIDVAIVWSIWPETFCFTAYEAAAGGAFIITNPLSGHVVDLASQPGRGLVVEDELRLLDLFRTGEILDRVMTARVRQSLRYSRMSADLILGSKP